MESIYLLENVQEGSGHKIDLSNFYFKLSEVFPSIKAQELHSQNLRSGGIIPKPTLVDFYALGRNQSLTVCYYLNSVFGADCKNPKEVNGNPRIIEKIEIIPKNLESSAKARLERLISDYN